MKPSRTVLALCFALLYSFAGASDVPNTVIPTAEGLNVDMVARIKVGSSSGAQVKELLGNPWRTVNYGDCNPVDYQEIWEYLGRDANGNFKIDIAFDAVGIAQIVAKTPAKGPVVVLAATPSPNASHQH